MRYVVMKEVMRVALFFAFVGFMPSWEPVCAQTDATHELFITNRDDVTHVFDASAEGRVRWIRLQPTTIFQTTTDYGEVEEITIPPSSCNGWDFEDSGSNNSPAGILAYSKYKLSTDDGYVYLDYRDTYYITGQFGSLDVKVFYDGYQWKFLKTGAGFDTVTVVNGTTVGIWTIIGRGNPDQIGFKIPITVQNNFSGGQITVDGNGYAAPHSDDWSLNTTHTIGAISPQNIGTTSYVWCAWSDGGQQNHNVLVTGNFYVQNYTADFLGTCITGPGSLFKGENGTYDCNPSGGSGNRNFQWYKQFDGIPTWYALGTSQTQRVTMYSSSFTLKVEVTDNIHNKTATTTKYVWRVGEPEAADSSSADGQDVSASQLLIYPNPFNPNTIVSYRLAIDAFLTLKVYDTRGREIVTLVDGWRSAGRHTTAFDASALASGIYWCVLRAGKTVTVMKMILIR